MAHKKFNWWAFLGKWLIYAFMLIVTIWFLLFIEPIVDIFRYEEIAVEIDAPLGTVKAQLHRARELMFELVKGKEHLL